MFNSIMLYTFVTNKKVREDLTTFLGTAPPPPPHTLLSPIKFVDLLRVYFIVVDNMPPPSLIWNQDTDFIRVNKQQNFRLLGVGGLEIIKKQDLISTLFTQGKLMVKPIISYKILAFLHYLKKNCFFSKI